MLSYSNIDIETFQWVKKQIEQTLAAAKRDIAAFVKADNKEVLLGTLNHFHQMVGSLQILELKSAAQLFLETERLIEDFVNSDKPISKSSTVTLTEIAMATLGDLFTQIEQNRPENLVDTVELINQIRAQRGLQEIEISSLFSPVVDVFPEINSKRVLKDKVYIKRAKALRVHYQQNLLKWLSADEKIAMQKIRMVSDKLLQMSAFTTVARLWWVARAYAECILLNNFENKALHGRVFRQLGDYIRQLESQGESALVSNSGEDLIKIMLFYIGYANKRSPNMGEIIEAFKLQNYFPELQSTANASLDMDQVRSNLQALQDQDHFALYALQQKLTHYFESEQDNPSELIEIIEQLDDAKKLAENAQVDVVYDLLEAASKVMQNVQKGVIKSDENTGLHLASAILFIDNSLQNASALDDQWQENGQLRLNALNALNSQNQPSLKAQSTDLTSSDRQALLDVVSSEVEKNLKDIERKLESFAQQSDDSSLLSGVGDKIRQVCGALQVLGEQKVSLLLKMVEQQFDELEQQQKTANDQLIEALAIAIGTMDEYVRGLKLGGGSRKMLLDSAITDLEVAIGKKVSRADVEDLLDAASEYLFSWLNNQADFDLFTQVKSALHDLNTLARKTNLIEVEHLVREQERLIDIISQEPAFLSDNITTNLQNNMASIIEQVIHLYGTDETEEEMAVDAELAYKKSAIVTDEQGVLIHDAMDLEELGDDAPDPAQETLSPTQIGMQYASNEPPPLDVDEAIFNAFIEESTEVLQNADSQHQSCLADHEDSASIRELRRGFHTLKGGARMVGLSKIGEVAWFSESLLNYTLDTEKPLTREILDFVRDAIDEIQKQLADRYANQHLIDTQTWSDKTEAIQLVENDIADEVLELVDESLPSTSMFDEYELANDNDLTLELDEYPSVDSALAQNNISTDAAATEYESVVLQSDEGGDNGLMNESFEITNGAQMRNVFLQEASANLNAIATQLEKPTLEIQRDDVISIAIHTLVGNALTMGLNHVAEVFALAEQLCINKQQSALPITYAEHQIFNKLVVAMRACLSNQQDTTPYFSYDTDSWNEIAEQLRGVLPRQVRAEAMPSDASTRDKKKVDNTFDITLEGAESPITQAELDSPDEISIERVAATLDEIELADLFVDQPANESEVDESDDDDLNEIEYSLTEFNSDVGSDNRLHQVTPLDDDVAKEATKDVEKEAELNAPISLISNELTNLIQDGLFDETEVIETQEPFDLVETTPEPDLQPALQATSKQLTPDTDQTDISPELREIFVNEMLSIRTELDDDVANLQSLSSIAPVLANVMRHLHTIKGSALMAEANQLGDLTHQTESYLEHNLIRNDDDIIIVRQTLEQYLDDLDSATVAYRDEQSFVASNALLQALGLAVSADHAPHADSNEDDEVEIFAEDIEQWLNSTAHELDKLNQSWEAKSDWQTLQVNMLEQYAVLDRLIKQFPEQLNQAASLYQACHNYLAGLPLLKGKKRTAAKALCQESSDALITYMGQLLNGEASSVDADIMAQLQEHTSASTPSVQTAQPESASPVNKRASALRIRTETLDSLTNYVGDASMNRSQMRDDVVSIKSVVNELYSNVQRFSSQLRDLEIEADSKITSRTNEPVNPEHGDEFDPLELDRYTKLQQLSRGLAENLDELNGIQSSLSNFVFRTENSLQKQDRLNHELQHEIMQVRLVSFGGIASQLRQVVRRTAQETNKQVELEIIGTEMRLDKTILDGVMPALEHMLRNAVDHGIEPSEIRRQKNKKATGKITLECRQVAREIIISLRDDGAGLDLEKIRKRAVDNNLLASDEPLEPQDVMMLISQSGFSTADKLTQISGRGVGMDVVQASLRRMSGSVAYDVNNDQPGSHFTIRLPISLAVTSAVFIQAGGEQFAIAARAIDRIVSIEAQDLRKYLQDDKPSIEIEQQHYNLVDLADYLGYGSSLDELTGKLSVILVGGGLQNIAVIVDDLFNTQEIVVKSLGDHLGQIPIYSGATIRAEGKIVLLLDLIGLSYYESVVTVNAPDDEQSMPTVLVVDDSLTVRKAAERDLNNLGINTLFAKDGINAQQLLADHTPDIILLDIEMPNMDGFELLEWLKQQASLQNIPVVVISSRATDKYVQKAKALGSTAFLGKPYLLDSLVDLFNQHLTLETPIIL